MGLTISNNSNSLYAVNAATNTWTTVSSTIQPNMINWNAGVTCDRKFAVDTFIRNVRISDRMVRGLIIDLPDLKSVILQLAMTFQSLSESFLDDFYDDLGSDDKHDMCISQRLSLDFIERHPDLLDDKECAEAISIFQELNQRFMTKHADKLEWNALSGNQSMSIAFIRKNIDRVKLDRLLVRQTNDDEYVNAVLSEFNCRDIRDAMLVISALSWHHELSEDNISSYIDMIDFNSPLLCDREFEDPSISTYRCLVCGSVGKR